MNKRIFPCFSIKLVKLLIAGIMSDRMIFHVKKKRENKKKVVEKMSNEWIVGRKTEEERERERKWQAVVRTKTTAMRGTKATQTAFPHVRSERECP